ncbi:hypothetical protein U27_03118 [Candidatus Vecturithrix granuli]|uniref:DUF7718 domain-containing protein n=1 Tax=Vecturithrix granuli TaxID=1499967 RepID=A0A081BV01_VECG1|nr:hypothetical protein U27_03118 [Candidatus Vecturithrix granuli]
MGRRTEYVIMFDDNVRKRHSHQTEKGCVQYFVVQLEVKVEDVWKVVIRYDCAHGFAHIDTYDLRGNQRKTELDLTFESALSYADWDLNENWEKYTQKFLRGEKL